MRGSSTRVLAPAKINLHLRVGPPAHDGFHPIVSWMVTVGLFDMLDLELSPVKESGDSGDGSQGLRLTCDDPSMPLDSSNLIVRAARAMREIAPRYRGEPWSVSVSLRKR